MRWRFYGAAAVSVLLVIIGLRVASVNRARVAAPLLLVDVVLVARFGGTGPALLTAALAAAGYAYDFLPPAGFPIDNPDDWVALVTFIVTAVVAGELASRAQRRAVEAQTSREEIERLYLELGAAFERASDAEAARRNEALKGALLDAITHNLRTPLTAIKASVTALIGDPSPSVALPGDGARELLAVIDEESDRLNRFIEGLSTVDDSPLASPVRVHAVAVGDLVHAARARAEALTRGHDVAVEVPDGLPGVTVDAASIVEVLYMLLDNASKFAPAGTRIVVGATRHDARTVRIAVADEGPGVPADLRERVFEKFFRVPGREAHDRRRVGAGLGLSIARRLVESQAGRLWVDATTGKRGTTVVMELPVGAPVNEGERANPLRMPAGQLGPNEGVAHG